ncbi:MAG TPA: P-loop NTPase [Planctomycetota bacterium]|nr:P-loop NTPase [Planctomycetota bacterium]
MGPARSGAEMRGASLGPRGRGLFDRLLSGLRGSSAPRQEAVTIAIASGKGGTGKSFIATSLAVLLHKAGLRTALVDCDFGLACDHLLMGAKPVFTMQQLVTGKATLDQVLLTTPCGPRLLPGASGVRKMAALADRELLTFAREIGALAGREDVLLLDLGAGIAPQIMLTMLAADHIVLVTQPEIAALVDAYAVLKCVAQVHEHARFLVLVNRVAEPGRGEQAFQKLTEVARQHVGVELHYLGEIEDDPRVGQHRLGQLPLVATDPDGAMSVTLAAIAARLQTLAGPLEARAVAADLGLEARFKQHRLFL